MKNNYIFYQTIKLYSQQDSDAPRHLCIYAFLFYPGILNSMYLRNNIIFFLKFRYFLSLSS